MGRRRGRGTPPPKPFDQAFEGIDTLEQGVMRRTLDVHFTPEQVVRWMFPDEIVDKLQAAYPYVRNADRGFSIDEELTLPVVFPAVVCNFAIQAKPVRMLVPEHGRVQVDETRGEQIMLTLRSVYDYHLQFEKVRRVVRWLNANATVGAGRHYCPWLTGILPADHPFQEANGQIYREPSNTMAEITHVMRECGAIMASALLCGQNSDPPKTIVQVSFDGQRENETYTSKEFGLL